MAGTYPITDKSRDFSRCPQAEPHGADLSLGATLRYPGATQARRVAAKAKSGAQGFGAWSEASDILAPDQSRAGKVGENISERRRQAILSGRHMEFSVQPNPEADSRIPWYEFSMYSEVSKYNTLIDRISKKHEVDPDLVRAIIYMETTHGYYDRLAEPFGYNATICPMNVHSDFWRGLGYSRKDLMDPEKNIEAGVRILAALQQSTKDAPIEELATLYNNLGATKISNYGARVANIYRTQPWRKQQ